MVLGITLTRGISLNTQDQENDQTKPKTERMFLKVFIGVVIIMTIPFVLFFGLFPLLQNRPFDSIDEIEVNQIQRLEVRIYNRSELDGGDDVGPYIAGPLEYDRLLKPLIGVSEVSQYDGARGPWLGEYRILLKNGRKGTVRFFYVPGKAESPVRAALGVIAGGSAAELAWIRGQIPAPAPRLRFEIGQHKYEAPTTKELIQAATRGIEGGEKRTRR